MSKFCLFILIFAMYWPYFTMENSKHLKSDSKVVERSISKEMEGKILSENVVTKKRIKKKKKQKNSKGTKTRKGKTSTTKGTNLIEAKDKREKDSIGKIASCQI